MQLLQLQTAGPAPSLQLLHPHAIDAALPFAHHQGRHGGLRLLPDHPQLQMPVVRLGLQTKEVHPHHQCVMGMDRQLGTHVFVFLVMLFVSMLPQEDPEVFRLRLHQGQVADLMHPRRR